MERERRILVIDDDEAIRTLLFTVLRRRGFAVDRARNGEEAIEAIQRCRYAVALVDLMMPIKSGWEVLDWMATQPKSDRPPAIVLTAGTTSRAMNPDVVTGTIRKPFDVELLLDIVSACADGHEVVQRTECPPPQSRHIRERPGGGDVN
jgi:two-component system, NtrC family, nitrogen regulation response regulator GlnG